MRYNHPFIVTRASQAALLLIQPRFCKSGPATFSPPPITRALFSSRSSLDPSHLVRHFWADICSRGSVNFCSPAERGGRFRMSSTDSISPPQNKESFPFGPYRIGLEEVFLTTKLSYAFVNLRPVVPGHVLVCPIREVHRYSELTSDEVIDLWLTAQRIGAKLEPFFEASSLTLAIQDGPEAGQTVPHVHVHILPRNKADFEKNDEIYDEIDKKEKELAENLNLDQERKDRTPQEMHEEASKLRALF